MKLDTSNIWRIKEYHLKHDYLKEHESIFSLANGYVGIRGFHPELADLSCDDSIYLNGFYDSETYIYGENAYGYAKNKQKMIPLPQLSYLSVIIDGETLTSSSRIGNYERELVMNEGILKTSYVVETKLHKLIEVEIRALVSHSNKNLIAFDYRFKTNDDCKIELISQAQKKINNSEVESGDPRVGSLRKQKYLHLIAEEVCNSDCFYKFQTDGSKLVLLAGLAHKLSKRDYKQLFVGGEYEDRIKFELTIKANEQFTFNKYIYFSDETIEDQRFKDNYIGNEKAFKKLAKEQKEHFAKFWTDINIELDCSEDILAALRFNLFSLFQHVGKEAGKNICAKGLSGEGYEGHYFWDTEIYMMPFFIYNRPEIARNLLVSRYKMLNKAKERAEELSYEGCLYAWRTINGEEASAYYPAGTAQIHLNADIAYAVMMYFNATKDDEFMKTMGLEMLRELADFFVSYADYIDGKGYVFNGVTGPDEYNALVNNNLYTNVMIIKLMKAILRLQTSFCLTDYGYGTDKLARYKLMANNIYIHRVAGFYAQDEAFFDKKSWDFRKRDKRPLLLHYHPMVIYKHQVLKQADIVLALLTDFKRFTHSEVEKIYEFYEPLTTHDSTLSETIHGIVASRINRQDEAFAYFENTIKTDLYNQHHNVDAGLHMAAMAGGWQSLFYGFAGIRIEDDVIYVSANLANKIKRLTLSFLFRGVKITIKIVNNMVEIDCSSKPEDAGFDLKIIGLGDDYA